MPTRNHRGNDCHNARKDAEDARQLPSSAFLESTPSAHQAHAYAPLFLRGSDHQRNATEPGSVYGFARSSCISRKSARQRGVCLKDSLY